MDDPNDFKMIMSMEVLLAEDRVYPVVEDVLDAWNGLRHVLLGALEFADVGTPHLAGARARIPAAVAATVEAERLAWAEVAATRAMLGEA